MADDDAQRFERVVIRAAEQRQQHMLGTYPRHALISSDLTRVVEAGPSPRGLHFRL